MATITTVSCARCNIPLYKSNGHIIGNPVLRCPRCQAYLHNPVLNEWYCLKEKWRIFLPLLTAPIAMTMLLWLIWNNTLSFFYCCLIGGLIGLVVGVIALAVHASEIAKSEERMKNPEHLQILLAMHLIDTKDFAKLIQQAGKGK